MSGQECLACQAGQPWARCSCVLACPAAGCAAAQGGPVPGPVIPGDLIIPAIPSAVTAAEAVALADLARGKTVLELGAHHGFSTVVLASVAAQVTSVDWHLGDPHAGLGDTWASFTASLARYGVAGKVVIVRQRFEQALPDMAAAGARFGGCFLDGMHDEESVTRDTALALPLIEPGGFMCWHDYGRGAHNGYGGFAVTEVADRYGVTGVAGCLAWWFTPLS